MSNVLVIVIARGKSRGIPRKNLVDLGGRPLISHIIKTALEALPTAHLVVSTEDDEIARVACEFGADVPFMRPDHLAGDHVPSLPVVQHAVMTLETLRAAPYDIVCYLQPTAPLCRPEDIRQCVDLLNRNAEAESAVTITEAETHPFRLKRLLSDGRLINFIDQGFEDMRPRQLLPKVYRRSGAAYVSRRNVVMEKNTLVGDPCLGVLVPRETATDIDSFVDLELVRLLYAQQNRKLD
jgi:CMP-N-acetylneuraminic acid synthetase